MRRQSPSSNNPANPLFKVAALEVDKEYAVEKGVKYIRVIASLVFKKSSDLRGGAKDKDGDFVNVTFGLRIKRASFELRCTDDRGQCPGGFVKISKIAYVGGLATKRKIKVKQSDASIKKGASKSSLNARLGASIEQLVPSASAAVGSSRQSGYSNENSVSADATVEKVNVTATHAGPQVHWEVSPSIIDEAKDDSAFLEGSVFKDASDGEYVDAAHIRRVDGKSISNVSITGSVYINMQDLILEDIAFTDNDGFAVALKQMPDQANTLGRLLSLPDSNKEAKERLLKQVIRKHLVGQGLRAEGNLVEICRASV